MLTKRADPPASNPKRRVGYRYLRAVLGSWSNRAQNPATSMAPWMHLAHHTGCLAPHTHPADNINRARHAPRFSMPRLGCHLAQNLRAPRTTRLTKSRPVIVEADGALRQPIPLRHNHQSWGWLFTAMGAKGPVPKSHDCRSVYPEVTASAWRRAGESPTAGMGGGKAEPLRQRVLQQRRWW